MQNNITNIAFSSDNNQLLTSDFSNDAWLWETNGIFLRKFEGHNSVISALAFSPDNTKILTGSRDQTVRLWPIKEGEAQIYNATNTVFDVAFSPDSNQIAYTSGNVVELIDLSGQKPKILSGHSDKVTSLAFSIDGKQILTGSFDGTARIWTLNKGELIQEIKSTTKRPHLVSFSSDGNHIVTQLEEYRQFKSENVSKQYWTLDGENISHLMENLNNPNSLLYQSGNELKSYIELHQVSSVGVSSDKKLILTGDEKGSIYLWGSNGLKIKEFSGNNGEIHTLQFSPNNALILTGDYQGAARLFDLNGNVKKISLGSSNSDSILSVKFSSDGQTVLAGSRGGDVGLFDLQGELIKRFTFFEDGGAQNLRPVKYSPVIFSPNGKLILTGSTNNTVRLWNLEGQIVHEYHGHKDFINDAAFSSDGSMIVTASVDGVIRIWRAPKDLESFLKNQKIGPLSLTQKKFYDID
jgi:WD40 repeat protein